MNRSKLPIALGIALGIAVAAFGPTFDAVGRDSVPHPQPKGSTWTTIDDRSAAAMHWYVDPAPSGGSHYYWLAVWKESIALADSSAPQDTGGIGVTLIDSYKDSHKVRRTRELRNDPSSTVQFVANGATGAAHLVSTLSGRSGSCTVNATWNPGLPTPDSSYSSTDLKEDMWSAIGHASGTCFDPPAGTTLEPGVDAANQVIGKQWGGDAKVWERIDRSSSSNLAAPMSPLPGEIIRLAGDGQGSQVNHAVSATKAFLVSPRDPQVAPDGAIYFLDGKRVSTIRNGMVAPVKGCSGFDGCIAEAIALDSKGRLLVSDCRGSICRLERIDNRGRRTTIVSKFWGTRPMAVSSDGTIYASDGSSHLARVRNGVVSWFGKSWCGQPAVGPLNKVTFCSVDSMTPGPDGSIYIADESGIRKITRQGNVESVYSMTASSAYTNCVLVLSCQHGIQSLAFAPDGNLYFYFYASASSLTPGGSAIVRLDHGQLIPVAGGGSCNCDDVPALIAAVQPDGMAFNRQGHLVIADGYRFGADGDRMHLADISIPPPLTH